jgi:enoyl-CoA hydratase/carnithine racemase
MGYRHIEVSVAGVVGRLTLNRPERRNALAADVLQEIGSGLQELAGSSATGVVLAANGPVFSAGHDFADVASRDVDGVRALLTTCTAVMQQMHAMPQVVIARVHALATAAGAQLIASADLAVAASSAGFALPGGKDGWFCHTPAVPVARAIGRKRLFEMALTGDVVDAATALDWGLVNRVVPDDQLDAAVDDLLARATRGSASSKGWGKRVLYAQLDRPESDAYAIAVEAMAAASQSSAAREGMAAFLGKRRAKFAD